MLHTDILIGFVLTLLSQPWLSLSDIHFCWIYESVSPQSLSLAVVIKMKLHLKSRAARRITVYVCVYVYVRLCVCSVRMGVVKTINPRKKNKNLFQLPQLKTSLLSNTFICF